MSNRIELRGCAPAPLLHYLKALGILRLVAEQLDADVRAAWQGDAFVLETAVSEEELMDFFLNRYRPTPMASPWNGGSGFYDGDDITGRDAILASQSERLIVYRQVLRQIMTLPQLPSVSHLTVQDLSERVQKAIDEAKNKDSKDVKIWTETVGNTHAYLVASQSSNLAGMTISQLEASKTEYSSSQESKANFAAFLMSVKKLRTIVKKFERSSGKDEIFRECRNQLDDKAVEWLDATLTLTNKESFEAPLLGAGGIDGKLEFAKNFMARLSEVLPELTTEKEHQKSKINLRSSLFVDCPPKLENASVGQFNPSGAGGAANASDGPKIDSSEGMVNPWDFILALEGSIVPASATVRKLAAGSQQRASFPFTVRNSAVGYGTAIIGEKVRAEIWLPLWSRFAGYRELAHIYGEGRVQFNSKQKRAVQTGFDFARAVAELGVDRGIDSFQRFAFIERNGQANLATPLGRFEVRERPLASRLYDFERWADRLRSATSDASKTPPRFGRAMKQLDEAMFTLCQSGAKGDLRAVLIALGAAEYELANGEKFCADKFLKPLSGLPEIWAQSCDDKSNEFQIAAALASINGSEKFKLPPLRGNLEGVDLANRDWAANDKGVVWGAGTLAENLSAVLQRRSIDARAAGASHPALQARRFASLSAIEAFLNHHTFDVQIENLLWGLMLVNWQGEETKSSFQDSIKYAPTLPRAYALLKLLFLPDGKLRLKASGEPVEIKHEPTIIPLLRAGRAEEAVQTAVRRMRSSGLAPFTETFDIQEEDAVRFAAALLIPIHQSSVQELARLVLRPKAEES